MCVCVCGEDPAAEPPPPRRGISVETGRVVSPSSGPARGDPGPGASVLGAGSRDPAGEGAGAGGRWRGLAAGPGARPAGGRARLRDR